MISIRRWWLQRAGLKGITGCFSRGQLKWAISICTLGNTVYAPCRFSGISYNTFLGLEALQVNILVFIFIKEITKVSSSRVCRGSQLVPDFQ